MANEPKVLTDAEEVAASLKAGIHKTAETVKDLAKSIDWWHDVACRLGFLAFQGEQNTKTLQVELEQARAERDRAASEMVERIRASLREYPHDGGDIGVMKEVERITSAFKDESLTAIAEMETAFGERDAAIAQVEHGDRLILDLKKELRTLREAAGRLLATMEQYNTEINLPVWEAAHELRSLLGAKGGADDE